MERGRPGANQDDLRALQWKRDPDSQDQRGRRYRAMTTTPDAPLP